MLDQFSLNPFPFDGERHKNDFALEAAYTGPSECDVIQVQFNNPA